MKHFYLLLVAMAAALTANATEFTYDNFRCVVNEDGNTVTIYQNYDNPPSGYLSIPSEVYNNGNTYRVTAIGEFGFSNRTAITEVWIPETVTTIGSYAFSECTGMTDVRIPETVTTIGGSAFSECTTLEEITIPWSVTAINEFTFARCTSLKNVTIPASITSLGRYIFYQCTGLVTLTSKADPSKVTMANNVFYEAPVESCELRVSKEYYDAYTTADQWKDFTNIVAMETGGTVTGDELPTVGELGDIDGTTCMCLVSGAHKWQVADYTNNNGNFTFTVYNEGEFTPKKTFTINTGNNSAQVANNFEMYPMADYSVIMTQAFFNDDDKYEVIISFRNGSNNYTHKVFNEDGEYLLTLPFTRESARMLVLGQNRYLMVYQEDDGRDDRLRCKVYHVHKSSLPVVENRQPADVNGDNVVSGADVTRLYDIILNE